ncbi:hypothetical protein D3C73_1081860 [compost metagenome]
MTISGTDCNGWAAHRIATSLNTKTETDQGRARPGAVDLVEIAVVLDVANVGQPCKRRIDVEGRLPGSARKTVQHCTASSKTESGIRPIKIRHRQRYRQVLITRIQPHTAGTGLLCLQCHRSDHQ